MTTKLRFLPFAALSFFTSFATAALAQPLTPPPPMATPPGANPTPGPTNPNNPGAPGYPANPGGGPNPGANGKPNGGSKTQSMLDKSQQEDSGRGLEYFWLSAEVGGGYLSMEAMSAKHLMIADEKSSGGGLTLGGALGGRFLYFTIGVRGRYSFLPDAKPWNIGPEIGFHIPLGSLEPHVFLGGGYMQVNGLNDNRVVAGDLAIRGGFVRVGAGLRYYLSRHFSMGAIVAGDFTFLSRKGVTISPDPAITQGTDANVANAAASGSGAGAGVTGTLALGIHF